MTADVTIRAAGTQDLQQIMRLATLSDETPRWSEALWQQVLLSSAQGLERTVLLAESCGRLIGFGVAGLVRDSAEIESVTVDPAFRRQGVGRCICGALFDWAKRRGVVKLTLEARVSNQAARALYCALGFQEHGRRKQYYQHPDEDAIVMVLQLSP